LLALIDVNNIHRKLTIPARSQLFFELFSLKITEATTGRWSEFRIYLAKDPNSKHRRFRKQGILGVVQLK
jgi:hypothetical protein